MSETPISIGAIENGLIAKVATAGRIDGAFGYAIRTVKSYGGEFDDGFKMAALTFPAVLFAFAGEAKPEERGGRHFFHQPVWVCYCITRNLRNEEAARHGVDGEIGSYQLIQDVRALLRDEDLDLGIDPIDPGAIRSILQGKNSAGILASIYQLDLHTSYTSAQADPTGLGDFRKFYADWDVPPHGNVQLGENDSLPAESSDMQSDVELEGGSSDSDEGDDA
jgi:phage gp37-like protein